VCQAFTHVAIAQNKLPYPGISLNAGNFPGQKHFVILVHHIKPAGGVSAMNLP
jgi:hypothetical protein